MSYQVIVALRLFLIRNCSAEESPIKLCAVYMFGNETKILQNVNVIKENFMKYFHCVNVYPLCNDFHCLSEYYLH